MIKRDHLPFANYIFEIAEKLPGAPSRPKFKIHHNQKYIIFHIRMQRIYME
jgi:hypothetical protein